MFVEVASNWPFQSERLPLRVLGSRRVDAPLHQAAAAAGCLLLVARHGGRFGSACRAQQSIARRKRWVFSPTPLHALSGRTKHLSRTPLLLNFAPRRRGTCQYMRAVARVHRRDEARRLGTVSTHFVRPKKAGVETMFRQRKTDKCRHMQI